jgi:hypothetical protein
MITSTQKSMVWFEGVVEDRINDPLKLFRVRVRVYALHTDAKQLIPTEELHWAQVMHPTTSAAVDEIGQTPSFVEGTHVIGFFRDGKSCQDPVVMGTVAGVPINAPDTTRGFNDPLGKYPSQLNEADTSRLARNEKTSETILQAKKDSIIKDSPLPNGGSVSQPENPYATKYPYNKVWQSESGHLIEMDDTPLAERVAITHRSGSFIEMHPDGTVTIKSVKDTFRVTTANDDTIVGDNKSVSVQGSGKLYVGGDYDVEVKGSYNIKVDKSLNVHVGEDNKTTVGGSTSITTDGDEVHTTVNGSIYQN